MNSVAVITNKETNETGIGHPDMVPKFSILDPTYLYCAGLPDGGRVSGHRAIF